jgi:hypothetical protein
MTLLLTIALLLGGCAFQRTQEAPPRSPAQVRAEIVRLMPAGAGDREGWATDIHAAFAAQHIAPTTSNLCAVLAVAEQESGFKVDPVVPGLAKIARREIDRRAAAKHVPGFVVDAALWLKSPDGRRYSERLAAARTEQQLSGIFQDFIGMVPLGKRLFGNFNPVHTGGPMQVSIAFAEEHARTHPYPFPAQDSVRHEVFTRRGGLYFGTAHLLGYSTAAYGPAMIYRFADFNAGRYASRNAAFQQALAMASGRPLDLDGDLVVSDSAQPSQTEIAARSLGANLGLDDRAIRRELERSNGEDFDRSPLLVKVFALAEARSGQAQPRAVLPRIVLKSPKITRRLTTEWFARRVDERFKRCRESGAG